MQKLTQEGSSVVKVTEDKHLSVITQTEQQGMAAHDGGLTAMEPETGGSPGL